MFMPSLLGQSTAQDGWLFLGLAACPPVININVKEGDIDRHCNRNNDWAQAILTRRPDIKTVILSSLGTPYFNGSAPSGYSRDAAFRIETTTYDGTLEDIFYHGLSDSVSNLLTAGKRVILMIDTPEMDFDPSRCVVDRPLRSLLARTGSVRCSVTRSEYLKRNREYREILSKIRREHPGVLIYDPIDVFCDARMCNVFHNGHSMYRDGDHLSVYGSEVAGAYFLRWMMQQGIPLSKETQDYATSVAH
jgi:SGNH domain (fused to AT3 domains)